MSFINHYTTVAPTCTSLLSVVCSLDFVSAKTTPGSISLAASASLDMTALKYRSLSCISNMIPSDPSGSRKSSRSIWEYALLYYDQLTMFQQRKLGLHVYYLAVAVWMTVDFLYLKRLLVPIEVKKKILKFTMQS